MRHARQEGLPIVRKWLFAHIVVYFPLELARGRFCCAADGKGLTDILTDRCMYSSALGIELNE